MKVNFFDKNCQEQTDAPAFGLCDDQNLSKAYINTDDKSKWVAVVKNENQQQVMFTAIDNCITIKRDNGDMERRCDGMLTYDDEIVFVELKEMTADWIQDATEQVRETIRVFSESNDLSRFRKKRAFLCNKKHPQFKISHQEMMQQFRNKTGVRLIIHNAIVI